MKLEEILMEGNSVQGHEALISRIINQMSGEKPSRAKVAAEMKKFDKTPELKSLKKRAAEISDEDGSKAFFFTVYCRMVAGRLKKKK
jgi:hypothetical protein